jgi:hypothetical protein
MVFVFIEWLLKLPASSKWWSLKNRREKNHKGNFKIQNNLAKQSDNNKLLG